MPQDLATATEGELDSLSQKLKKKTPICKSTGDSFLVQLRDNMALMKSPIFVIHVLMFAVGNCTATLSLNFVNDYMCYYTQGLRSSENFRQVKKCLSAKYRANLGETWTLD